MVLGANGGGRDVDRDEVLHLMVARVATEHPNARALVHGDRTISYRELDSTADGGATALASRGTAPGHVIPVVLPRSTDLVISLLAVLKTGAAYALLDPSWPRARLLEVINDLDSPVVVTNSDLGLDVPRWSPGSSGGPPVEPPSVSVTDEHAATVFFTSGTTGRSKGVVTPHRATARLFRPDTFARFSSDTVIPLAAALPWDAFSLELWAALLNGGTAVVIDEPYLTPTCLRRVVADHGVDTVWVTSSLFDMIVDEDNGAFTGLAQVMTGGERLSTRHVARFLDEHTGTSLINGYGPVESTVFATTHSIVRSDCAAADGIPLGRPVPGTDVHVLIGNRSCAVDEEGEICIGGDGLAIGYLRDPQLTAAAFVDIDIGDGQQRLYRTGDRGWLGDDGLLHFAGRADRQLKVSGHRIEPVALEGKIIELLPVRDCRVIGRPSASGRPASLLAFCVPSRPGDALDGAEDDLKRVLPRHECPALVVPVDALPLTSQGKLDERRLLELVPTVDTGTVEHTGDPMVDVVRSVFANVLGVSDVATNVPFLALGGTSLDCGRVCARLSATTGRPVPLSWLYRWPTVEALAGRLRRVPDEARDPSGADSRDVDLSPMQLVFLTRLLVDEHDRTGHCLLTWVVEGPLDLAALDDAIVAVHERQPALRAEYEPDPRPHVSPVDIEAPELELLAPAPSVESALAAVRSALDGVVRPMDGEVWQTALAPISDNLAVLGVVVHHIAFDGWSESVLAGDLSAAYNHPRPDLSITRGSVADLRDAEIARRSTVDDDPAVRHDVINWLRDAPDLSWPGTAGGGSQTKVIDVAMASNAVQALDAAAAQLQTSRFVVLLSCHAAALAAVTGQSDFVVGVPVRQRAHTALQSVVGCFINTVGVRFDSMPSVVDGVSIERTAAATRRAMAGQDVAVAEVLEQLGARRSSRPPVFQTLFALQDNPVPRLDLAGVRTSFVRQPYYDVPLELHAEIWPRDDDGGLLLEITYRTCAVDQETAESFKRAFLANTEGVANDGAIAVHTWR